MLTRHTGLTVFLLLGVVGHAELLEALTHRAPPWWQIGFAVIFAPIALVLLGEWTAQDAESLRWRRVGWGAAAFGAGLHLVLDFSCLALPWLGVRSWRFGLAGSAAAGVVMGLALRRAVRGLRSPEAPEPDPAAPAPPGLGPRVRRELGLFGGTAFSLLVVSLGFVGMAAYAVVRRPEAWRDLRLAGAAGFFGLCALIAMMMGLERRALLLGIPPPLAGLRRRLSRGATYVAAREGLLFLGRRQAVLYRWDAIASVATGLVHDNAAVLVELLPGVIGEPLRVAPSPRALEKWARSQRRSFGIARALYGADLVIMSMFAADGPGPLARVIAQGVADPTAREGFPPAADLVLRLQRHARPGQPARG